MTTPKRFGLIVWKNLTLAIPTKELVTVTGGPAEYRAEADGFDPIRAFG